VRAASDPRGRKALPDLPVWLVPLVLPVPPELMALSDLPGPKDRKAPPERAAASPCPDLKAPPVPQAPKALPVPQARTALTAKTEPQEPTVPPVLTERTEQTVRLVLKVYQVQTARTALSARRVMRGLRVRLGRRVLRVQMVP
jgi:hypothetical protein